MECDGGASALGKVAWLRYNRAPNYQLVGVFPTLKTYRILAVAATPFFVDRGGHIHIYEPIKALQRLGHQVVMTTYHIGRDLPDIDIRRIPPIPWYTKTDAGPSYQKPYLAFILLMTTLWTAWRFKPDILHAHGWDSMWVAWWVNRLMGIPFIFDMQGSFSGEIAEHGYAKKGSAFFRFLERLERLSLNGSPVVVTSSTQIYEESRSRFGLADDHLYPIFDGVDTETFSPENFPYEPELFASLNLPANKPIVVFMGLLKTYQGVDDMIEAVRVLVKERDFHNFHFLVMGFPDEDYYRKMAAEKGISAYMTFTGKIPYDETGRYMALSDLAIAPKISMTEGDAKIYFYMAMGLPVVAYERPASVEILGDLGIYATYNDPVDMARALHETLDNPALMQERGAQNRQKAITEYSWDAVANRIVEAYGMSIRKKQATTVAQSAWRWLRLLLGLFGLVALIGFVDFDEVVDALSDANLLYLVPAWFLIIGSTMMKTLRWRLLLHQNKVDISFRRLFGTYLIGSFYSQFLPGASAGGDAMRMAESSLDTGRAVDSVASVIIERVIGLISILATSSLILLISQPEGIPTPVIALIYGLTTGGITGLIVLRLGWFVGLATGILRNIRLGGIAEKVEALSHALKGDLGNPRNLFLMVVLSLLANACSMTAFYLSLLAVTDPVPYFTFISLVALIITLEVIPLTPGSLGIREGAYVFFLGYLGITEPNALSIALLIRVLSLSQALLGGMVLLQRALGGDTRPHNRD